MIIKCFPNVSFLLKSVKIQNKLVLIIMDNGKCKLKTHQMHFQQIANCDLVICHWCTRVNVI